MTKLRALTDEQVEHVRNVWQLRAAARAKWENEDLPDDERKTAWHELRVLANAETLADDFGVSVITIKRIFRGWQYVQPETKKPVLRLAVNNTAEALPP